MLQAGNNVYTTKNGGSIEYTLKDEVKEYAEDAITVLKRSG